MEKLLLVSGPRGRDALTGLLRELGFPPPDIAANSGEARRKLTDGGYSVVLINCPLPDEFGRELALSCADSSAAGVMLLVAADEAPRVAAGVEKHGVCVLPKPLSRQLLAQRIRLVQASARRLRELDKRNRQLMRKLENMQVICRAKCALVRYRDMTEAEAHRYIEQQAMDQRVTSRDVALDIIQMFEG